MTSFSIGRRRWAIMIIKHVKHERYVWLETEEIVREFAGEDRNQLEVMLWRVEDMRRKGLLPTAVPVRTEAGRR